MAVVVIVVVTGEVVVVVETKYIIEINMKLKISIKSLCIFNLIKQRNFFSFTKGS